jgi:murein DD-endopeptidase MepM/ murein hydrolase activator NlpD
MLAVARHVRSHARRLRRSATLATVALATGALGLAGCSPPSPSGAFIFPLSRAQAWGPATWSQDQGVDINAPCGANLAAPAAGRIIGEGISGFGPYAPRLLVDSGPLAGRMIYLGHVQHDYVRVGAHVRAGQWIAQVGTLGISFGCHVEIGISWRGSMAIPAYRATSAEMLQLLRTSYAR